MKFRRITLTFIVAPDNVMQWIVEKPLLHIEKQYTKIHFNTKLYKK